VEESKETPKHPSIVDWLGPGPTVSIILTVGSAIIIGALSLYSLVGAHADGLSHLTKRSDDHEERIREQEFRPPRLSPEMAKHNEELIATRGRVAVIEEQIRSMEARIVGVGPLGWHRCDHDLYAKMQDERNNRIMLRLDLVERRQEEICERIANCAVRK
jgi:hypothetical protein